MKKFIPLSVPNLKGNELKYVVDAVEKEWVSTGGAYINEFEDSIAKYLNVESAVACQSGTAGIHLSLILSGVDAGDEVIVPTLTFVAAVNPVRYIGAEPIFMDCDDSLTMDANKLKMFCEEECEFIDGKLINKLNRNHIKAIIVVHVFGNSVNIEMIMDIAQKYNLKVIEDATEALGTKFISGKYIGKYAGTIGDFGVYSFNGNKIITTGGGGMMVSNHPELLAKGKYLSTQAKDDELYYIHDEIGYNYRMTNLQAALGVAQLEQLDKFIEIKKKNYELYNNGLKNTKGLTMLDFNKNIQPNYWFYSLLINNDIYPLKVKEIIPYLKEKNIQVRPIWNLIHTQKPYRESRAYKIDRANYYLENVINIPCSSNLTEEEVNYVINVLNSI
ncbi:MAG: LegC family aminotransferase [Clostridium sulfidigenes]|uniref:LegC family aminotransferase n=1 Tax=Clostridium sulfidigenes TaxID=318464 RepID=A0A927ZTC4_9CLOT|nr:LegC family aminotransferase [Clostridium sulfidigenes]